MIDEDVPDVGLARALTYTQSLLLYLCSQIWWLDHAEMVQLYIQLCLGWTKADKPVWVYT